VAHADGFAGEISFRHYGFRLLNVGSSRVEGFGDEGGALVRDWEMRLMIASLKRAAGV
jgi:hypothetical protein